MLQFKRTAWGVMIATILLSQAFAQSPPPNSTEIQLHDLAALGLDATRVLLQQHLQAKRYTPIDGQHGFLMKVPNSQTVAVVPWPTLGDIDLAAPGDHLKAWYLDGPNPSSNHISIDKSFLPQSNSNKLQFTLAHVPLAAEAVHAATVLTANPVPPQPAQWVYFLCAEDKIINGQARAGPVRVFKAEVIELNHRDQKGDISFGFFGKVDVQAIHSGVLVDQDFKAVGISNGYYPEGTHGNQVCGRAFQIGTLLDIANLPPAVPEPVTVSTPVPLPQPATTAEQSSTAPPTPAVKSVDDPAAKALRVAVMYESSEQYGPARKKFRQIIELYPSSPSAASAQSELKKIEGK